MLFFAYLVYLPLFDTFFLYKSNGTTVFKVIIAQILSSFLFTFPSITYLSYLLKFFSRLHSGFGNILTVYLAFYIAIALRFLY